MSERQIGDVRLQIHELPSGAWAYRVQQFAYTRGSGISWQTAAEGTWETRESAIEHGTYALQEYELAAIQSSEDWEDVTPD